jgi:hypothetical protein
VSKHMWAHALVSQWVPWTEAHDLIERTQSGPAACALQSSQGRRRLGVPALRGVSLHPYFIFNFNYGWFNICPGPRLGTKPMMRRDFIKFIISSLALHPLAAAAQRQVPIVGALSPAARPAQFESSVYASFPLGMRELGYAAAKDF